MAKRKRIYIDAENLIVEHFSGIGHYTAELLKSVDKTIAEHNSTDKFILSGYFRRLGRLNRFHFKNFYYSRFIFPVRVSNMLKIKGWQLPIDLIYGKKIYVFPNYTSWPTLFSKSIVFIYDISFISHREFVEPGNQIFLEEQVQKSVKRASKIITISTNSRREIIDHFGVSADDVVICYPRIDTRVFYRRSQNEVAKVKAKYGIFDKYILFVGNLEPRKNLKGLLLAYEKLPKKVKQEYSLLLVGASGWLNDEIHEVIIRMRINGDRVIQPTKYVGDSDLPALYSGASVFAYVSLYEGFGIPPVEAMACGTPVVCSNNSSLPEAVGNAARLVDAKSVNQIKDGMLEVLEDKKLQKKMISNGYKQVEKYSKNDSAEIFLNVIESI
jgi:glycosyltransferase involved in cell wall biosynthesis